MSRRLVNITLDNLGDLPPSCRSCVFWELDPISKARAEASDPGLEKESWISSVLLEWGSCGKLLYVDGVPAAYVLYAPPQYVPRSVAFPTKTLKWLVQKSTSRSKSCRSETTFRATVTC